MDTQRHLLECRTLLAALTVEEEEQRDAVKYDDLFGDMEMQIHITPVMICLLEIQEGLGEREGLPVGTNAGPSLHCIC